MVHCSLTDALRSTMLWILILALLLRKSNRTGSAWWILLLLVGIHLGLRFVATILNDFFIFYLHVQACSISAEILSFFAQSWAILFLLADTMKKRNPFLRFILMAAVLLLTGGLAVRYNFWISLPSPWLTVIIYTGLLMTFIIGNTLIMILFYKLFRNKRWSLWYTAFCLILGLGPILYFGITEYILSRSMQLISSLEFYRKWIALSVVFGLPYFIFFCFVLLAIRCSFYGQRFKDCFGLPC
ncbi:MAG: hypothetical protein GY845_08010 [Planctomycetes bacterium]|nr:hypothetical protein [Planctomycetota bacterium]